MEGLIGLIGGAIFFSSWLLQAYETKKAKTSIVTKKFFIIRFIASIILIYEAFRVNSIGFIFLYIASTVLIIYNIAKSKWAYS